MANTIRLKVYRLPAVDMLFIMVPGTKHDCVIAPGSFGSYGIDMVAHDLVNTLKDGQPGKFTITNLNNMYNQRQLKHRKVQKFFVDVRLNHH